MLITASISLFWTQEYVIHCSQGEEPCGTWYVLVVTSSTLHDFLEVDQDFRDKEAPEHVEVICGKESPQGLHEAVLLEGRHSWHALVNYLPEFSLAYVAMFLLRTT